MMDQTLCETMLQANLVGIGALRIAAPPCALDQGEVAVDAWDDGTFVEEGKGASLELGDGGWGWRGGRVHRGERRCGRGVSIVAVS